MKLLSRLFRGIYPNWPRRRRHGLLGIETLEDRTVPASVTVVPLTTAANNSTTFFTLEDAIKAAGTNGTVTVEPGAIADFNIDITQSGLTVQGDPNVPSSILPGYNISIDANNVLLRNLNINFVSVNPGFNHLTVTHSTVNSIFISGGPSGNGGNVITQNYITSDITAIGNTDLGLATNDVITNNTFASFSNSVVSVTSDNGAIIADNTINGGGSISTDTAGNSITKAPQTGITVNGGVNVKIANNNIQLAGQNGTPAGTTGSFTGIVVGPFDPATAGLPAGTIVWAPTVQVLNNTLSTGRGIGLAITAPTTPTGDRDTQVLVQGNNFHNDLIGVSYTGNKGSSLTTDLGGGLLGSLGGNDFRGYTNHGTAAAAAIVLQGVDTSAVLTARSNMFTSTASPANVVFAGAGNIDVTAPLTNNQAFVQSLFNSFLGRTGTISELNFWASNLNGANGQSTIVNGIVKSTESLNRIVNSMYLQYLGRSADSLGQAYWVSQIQAGASLESIQAGFISSAEFISSNNSDYIQGLYRTFLGRTGSSSELAYWYSQLPSMGLSGVALGFATSQENRRDFIAGVFRNDFHRAAAGSELTFWAGQNGDLLSIETQLLSTPEFFNNG
jgi:hypothetical protein